ncbi:unnamed protein product [Anisakis simplex]|uniref:Uncharacterized protein n=1 Tax=Anisakis simplex TaxID=6269 RepID=A0A0M3KET2_ANISI|nr:unnamed protein product [Anisakis simplex]
MIYDQVRSLIQGIGSRPGQGQGFRDLFDHGGGELGNGLASGPLVPAADLARLVRSCDEDYVSTYFFTLLKSFKTIAFLYHDLGKLFLFYSIVRLLFFCS